MRRLLLATLTLGLLAPPALAQTYTETADAGFLPGTADDLTGATYTQIDGTMEVADGDVDMYCVYVDDPAGFSATTEPGIAGGEDDTRLFLFNADGTGVYYNDDTPDAPGLLSTLPAGDPSSPAQPGVYCVAVTHYDYMATDDAGTNIFCELASAEGPGTCASFEDVLPPEDPALVVAAWDFAGPGPTTTTAGAAYSIALTGVGTIVAVEDDPSGEFAFGLLGVNPFTASTTLGLRATATQAVRATLHDLLGREVTTLFDGVAVEGAEARIRVDGADLPAGLYIVRVTGETFSVTRTLTRTR